MPRSSDPRPVAHGGAELVRAAIAEALRRARHDTPPGPEIPTGLMDLDLLTGGWRSGALALLAGRTATGTSLVALGTARTAAVRHGVPTVLATLAMPVSEVGRRLAAAASGVPVDRLRGLLLAPDRALLGRALHELREAPLTVLDLSVRVPADPDALVAALEPAAAQARLLVVDDLDAAVPPLPPSGREAVLRGTARALVRLARRHDCAVVGVVRLPWLGSEEPDLSDVAEATGAVEEADRVVVVHRPESFGASDVADGVMVLSVLKDRYGPTGSVQATFQPRFARLIDAAPPPVG